MGVVYMPGHAPKDDETTSIDGGDGGGDDPGVERRLSEVEKAIVRIDGRLDGLGVHLSAMEAKITALAASVASWKWQFVGALIVFLLASLGGNYTVQQMTVSTFQAAAEASAKAAGQVTVDRQAQPIIINVPAPAAPASQ